MKRWKKTKEESVSVETIESNEEIKSDEMLAAEEVSMEAELSEISENIADDVTDDEIGEFSSEIITETGEEPGEVVLEENSEELSVEEVSVEETPIEETLTEDKEQEEKKRIKINKKAILITIGAIVTTILAIYFGVAFYYSEKFLMNTTVNGAECTGKTVKEVENMMQTSVEEYVLTLEERHGITEEIEGVDIGIKYNGVNVISDAMAKQNSFLWVKSLFKKNNIKAKIDFEYDTEKLDETIGKLECLKEEKQVAPISAVPVYRDGVFEIEEEVYGTQIDSEQLYKVIRKSVDEMELVVDLIKENCYVPPLYTKDSQEVLDAKDALNKCLEAEITYSLDEITVKLDKEKIANWISVDENLLVVVDENQVRAFADTLGSYYNTPNTALDLTTPTGKVVNIPNARLGRVVGSAVECAELIEEIKSGTVVTREPLFSQGATPGGDPVWGTTYLEVDISAQHMWYIVDGAVAFESDVVTGSPGRDTPTGVFSILKMKRNKTLTGNIVPATGKPEYVTPVAYWMRITWSGVGFHDATWQPGFGGQLYRQGYGSHGCINMPYNNVATLYGMVSVGCPVVIHY